MAFDFAVLGATGLQGRIVAKDLFANGYSVLLCGRDKSRVEDLLKKHKNKTGFEYIDANNTEGMAKTIKKSGADVVVNCIEDNEFFYLNIVKACIKSNVHCVDLGAEIPVERRMFALDGLLNRKKLTVITGCGSVPGVGNVMLGYAVPKFDSIHTIHQGYNWKSNINKFVVPFSIGTIMEEFTNPATVVKQGKFVKINPMDHMVYLYPRDIGKQKSWNEKHPEYFTFMHYYKNKGLKNVKCFAGFPKHSFDRINTLVELGFASKNPVKIKGIKVKPIEFLTEVLKRIKVPKGYKETENLWVKIYGKKNNKPKKMIIECVIHTLEGWEEDYTNIDTGMPCSIMAQMIKKG